MICDFASAQAMGAENPVVNVGADGLVDVNGLHAHFSDFTDRFALASVIYEVESGCCPQITAPSGILNLPTVDTGSKDLDTIILKAWLGAYNSTMEMYRDLLMLAICAGFRDKRLSSLSSQDVLQKEVQQWREHRLRERGS